MSVRKHLTAEAQQDARERIAQHNENLSGWLEGGWLVPTEPDPEERAKTVAALFAARDELVRLLVKWCGDDEEYLLSLNLAWDGGVANVCVSPGRIRRRSC